MVRVIIVENSLSEENFLSVKKTIQNVSKFKNVFVIQSQPGLASARNKSFQHLADDIIHFMDDDIVLPINYFEVVDRTFFENQDTGGLAPHIRTGAILSKKTAIDHLMKAFLKPFNTEGKLSKSGRAAWFSRPGTTRQVNWLPGCCMAYRLEVINDFRFETRLENGPLGGYALGEDLDFSHRVSKVSKLLYLGNISIFHKLAPNNRTNWLRMDEGIGRLRAFLLNRFPEDLRISRVIFSLIIEGSFDLIRIHVTRKKNVGEGYVHFTRLRSFYLERRECKLLSKRVENEN